MRNLIVTFFALALAPGCAHFHMNGWNTRLDPDSHVSAAPVAGGGGVQVSLRDYEQAANTVLITLRVTDASPHAITIDRRLLRAVARTNNLAYEWTGMGTSTYELAPGETREVRLGYTIGSSRFTTGDVLELELASAIHDASTGASEQIPALELIGQ